MITTAIKFSNFLWSCLVFEHNKKLLSYQQTNFLTLYMTTRLSSTVWNTFLKIYVIPMPECELPTTISLSSLTFFNQIINIILEYI